jgi:hypothetical protein
MALQNAPVAKFNRGIVDERALARVDIERIAISAETQTNWMPRSLGSMTIRPGLEFITATRNNAKAKYIPFIFSNTDVAHLELTDLAMRVLVDEKVVQREGVSTSIANGTFDSNVASWTDNDEAGATSAWVAGGYLGLTGSRFNAAIRRQQVSVAAPTRSRIGGMFPYKGGKLTFDRKLGVFAAGNLSSSAAPINGDTNVPHGLAIVINRGPVEFKIGTTTGGNEILETTLETGRHSFTFTPTGDFHLEFASRAEAQKLVDSVAIEAGGDMVISTPWLGTDLDAVRYTQSADFVFVAGGKDIRQQIIKRRGTRSWSVVDYAPEDGPFLTQNVSTTTITSNALAGDATLTASRNIWTKDHVGALFRMRSVGQKVSAAISGAGNWSDGIRVIGVDNSRIFQITITGSWTATVTLQRSVDDEANWTDVTTYTSNQASVDYDDTLDNTTAFYRIGVDTGDYTSGTATVTLVYSGGGISGIARITAFTSATSVSAAILENHRLGSTTATEQWWEGIWSTDNGFPSAAAFYEGRLWWAGLDRIIGSVSDAYLSFDDETEGDSAPISRTLGSGSSDTINWVLSLQRLIIGHAGAEVSARSSFLDEPLTPTQFNLKDASTQGSATINALKVDNRGLFVQKSKFRLFEMTYAAQDADYASTDMSILVPDIGSPGITHIAVQRQPDTRVHCVRSNGTVALLLYLPAEDVKAWINIETGDADGANGVVEDVVVLPGDEEDKVYYVVSRVINGVQKRYLEKWAKESECVGGALTKLADSFKVYDGPKSLVLEGLEHLEGATVIAWRDGVCPDDASGDVQTFTVTNGAITLDAVGGSVVVGLPYTSAFLSGLLPYAAGLGTVLGARQQIGSIALLLKDTHHKGIQFGRDADNLDELPQVIDGATVTDDTVHASLTHDAVAFPGESTTDTRFFLKGEAPRPVTIKAAVVGIVTRDVAP